ncbi:hypothetical protein Pla123a_06060 [Posidoniimonas polymericola]|uniref:Uncharacterized protein n=1 Tax=Posidoniimonas polymericola TaxID=2528002 RepID=A0A5C5ZEE4_9BACT|nr:hypothetical protein [Posidoniimonas polymericola]TWT85799.1 hypothetical protein Pla123a_06060 [Posidoniimonas polymericola]
MKSLTINLLLAAVLLVVLSLGYLLYSRAALVARYSELLINIAPRELVEVDEEEFSRWLETLESDDWEVLRTGNEGYSQVLPNFVPYGFEPTINGFLDMQTMPFPPAEPLSNDELRRLSKAAELRASYDSLGPGGTIYVCRRDGVVLGFYQSYSRGSREYSILEDGGYVIYIAQPKNAQKLHALTDFPKD